MKPVRRVSDDMSDSEAFVYVLLAKDFVRKIVLLVMKVI